MHKAQERPPLPYGPASTEEASTGIDRSLLSDLSKFVEARMGLYFPEERMHDLDRNIRTVAGKLGHTTVEKCIKWLLTSELLRSQVETLASHLAVGETYFFRDKGTFDALTNQVLPELIRFRRGKEQRLRIWSAGCSTGEEAYSMAILLDRMIADLRDWSVTILATDINPDFLDKAAKGIYTEWSFRDTPEWVKEGYFIKREKRYEILRRIRKMVTFSYHNLVDDPYPALTNNTSAMDIISCRNVLMYFSPKRAKDVLQSLKKCLLPGGWLLVSPVEASRTLSYILEAVKLSGGAFYRKAEANRGTGDAEKRGKEETADICSVITSPIPDAAYSPAPRFPHSPIQEDTSSPLPRFPASPVQESLSPLQQARELAGHGRLSEALELCTKAIKADKLNPSLHYLQATILEEIGRPGEAAASMKRAIYIDQDFVLAHFALGYLMRLQDRHREAQKHLDNALTLLRMYDSEEILPESEGLSAGRLMEIIETMRTTKIKR